MMISVESSEQGSDVHKSCSDLHVNTALPTALLDVILVAFHTLARWRDREGRVLELCVALCQVG